MIERLLLGIRYGHNRTNENFLGSLQLKILRKPSDKTKKLETRVLQKGKVIGSSKKTSNSIKLRTTYMP